MSVRAFGKYVSERNRACNKMDGEMMCGAVSDRQRMSMRDLEVLSSIDPITTTSTGDSECESRE